MSSDDEIINRFFREVNSDSGKKRELANALRTRDKGALYRVVQSLANAIWGAAKMAAASVIDTVVKWFAADW